MSIAAFKRTVIASGSVEVRVAVTEKLPVEATRVTRAAADTVDKPSFQGGAMPMFRRVPKRGFNNRWALTVFAVNVGKINEAFEDGAEVTLEVIGCQGFGQRHL